MEQRLYKLLGGQGPGDKEPPEERRGREEGMRTERTGKRGGHENRTDREERRA